jgi:hypothetical protein
MADTALWERPKESLIGLPALHATDMRWQPLITRSDNTRKRRVEFGLKFGEKK